MKKERLGKQPVSNLSSTGDTILAKLNGSLIEGSRLSAANVTYNNIIVEVLNDNKVETFYIETKYLFDILSQINFVKYQKVTRNYLIPIMEKKE